MTKVMGPFEARVTDPTTQVTVHQPELNQVLGHWSFLSFGHSNDNPVVIVGQAHSAVDGFAYFDEDGAHSIGDGVLPLVSEAHRVFYGGGEAGSVSYIYDHVYRILSIPPLSGFPRRILRSTVGYGDFSEVQAFRGDEAVMSKIDRLRALEDGWLDKISQRPSAPVLDWLAAHSGLLAFPGLSILPLGDGSVALQWTDGTDEYLAEVRPDLQLYTFVDHRGTDDFDEDTAPLSEESLSAFLAQGRG